MCNVYDCAGEWPKWGRLASTTLATQGSNERIIMRLFSPELAFTSVLYLVRVAKSRTSTSLQKGGRTAICQTERGLGGHKDHIRCSTEKCSGSKSGYPGKQTAISSQGSNVQRAWARDMADGRRLMPVEESRG